MWFNVYAQADYKKKNLELVAIVKEEELLKHVKSYYENQYVDIRVEEAGQTNENNGRSKLPQS